MQSNEKRSVLLVGLGVIGRAIGSKLAESNQWEIVGAVDRDTELIGRPLDLIIPHIGTDARVVESIETAPLADVAFVATSSFIKTIEPTVLELIHHGIHVVSICEELGFGFFENREIATRIDEAARQANLTVLGTGANPGVLMDTLPLLLSSLTFDVTRITMSRTADMSGYGPILKKFGFGLMPDEFFHHRQRGNVIGHVGFRESIAALAHGLGWSLDAIQVDEPIPLLVTQTQRTGQNVTLGPGTVATVRHMARGFIGEQAVIEAVVDFGIFDPGDPTPRGSTWSIESAFQTVNFSSGPLDSYLTTVAVVGNVLRSIFDAPRGLITMAELPPKSISGK